MGFIRSELVVIEREVLFGRFGKAVWTDLITSAIATAF
jgi:hypothetical protein